MQKVSGSNSIRLLIRRGLGVVITLAIFGWMLKPVVLHWDQVRPHIGQTDWGRVVLASAMFAAFLFVFRATSWRWILIGFGHRLPVAAATRIWCTSELARYLPGVIWQVIGRAYLVRRYGVSASVCSASQVLEVALFLLANIALAVGCLTWFGHKVFHGVAQNWLIAAIGLIPVLFTLVHPKIFYGVTNRILTKLGKPSITAQLRFRQMWGLALWALIGLLWQSLAMWLVVSEPLHLKFAKWWVVAGAYSLAWCAGFLAFWAPGGLGVRELVFVTAVRVALPAQVLDSFEDPKVLLALLGFLSVLLRIWVTSGELILAALAYGFDHRGALGRADAPGIRVAPISSNSQTGKPNGESSSAASPAM